jgi:hypothetical protein
MAQPRWIDGGDLGGYLKQQCGLDGIHNITTDRKYVFPSKDYILGEFSDYFQGELERLGLLEQTAESNDCDDRALLAMALGRARHHKTLPGFGVVWGIIKYEIGGLGASQRAGEDRRHWLNFGAELFSWSPVLLKPFFVNMPSRREELLRPEEIQTCEVRFF